MARKKMKSEIKNFEVIAYIVENGEVISLKKRENLDVEFEGCFGKAEKLIIFEKNNKIYRILVKVLLKNYLWGTRCTVSRSKFFVPPHVGYQIYKGEPPPKGYEYSDEGVEIINQWRTFRIFTIIFSILIFFLFFYFFEKLLENYQKSFALLYSIICLIIIIILIKTSI